MRYPIQIVKRAILALVLISIAGGLTTGCFWGHGHDDDRGHGDFHGDDHHDDDHH